MLLKDFTSFPEKAVEIYYSMCLYRRFDLLVAKYFLKRKFDGMYFSHLGREGIVAGVTFALQPKDYVLVSHFSHIHALAKGSQPERVLAEIFQKPEGICSGQGGLNHIFDRDRRFFGGTGISGSHIAIASGLGLSIRLRRSSDICVCFLDGTLTNHGIFHEMLNACSTNKVPILFVLENSKYAVGTDIRRTTSVDYYCERASSYNLDAFVVNGTSALEVLDHVECAVKKMRFNQDGPCLMEVLTYPAHFLDQKNMSKEIFTRIDPIRQLENEIVNMGWADMKQLKALDSEVIRKIRSLEIFLGKSGI